MLTESLTSLLAGCRFIYVPCSSYPKKEYSNFLAGIGEIIGISAAQIRKDISQFGEFGKQGTGYSIPLLIERLRDILKVDRVWEVVIVGHGRYRTCPGALQRVCQSRIPCHHGVRQRPPEDRAKGGGVRDFRYSHAAEKVKQNKIKIAMLTAPAISAQEITDLAGQGGHQGDPELCADQPECPTRRPGQYIDPVAHLQRMTYYLD